MMLTSINQNSTPNQGVAADMPIRAGATGLQEAREHFRRKILKKDFVENRRTAFD